MAFGISFWFIRLYGHRVHSRRLPVQPDGIGRRQAAAVIDPQYKYLSKVWLK